MLVLFFDLSQVTFSHLLLSVQHAQYSYSSMILSADSDMAFITTQKSLPSPYSDPPPRVPPSSFHKLIT